MPELELQGHSLDDFTKTVGFIGVGVMGGPMARNLAKAGVDLVVRDLNPDYVEHVVAVGARAAASTAEIVELCDVILVCVVDDEQVENVVNEILETARGGQLVVVHSTIRPTTVQLLGDRAAAKGVGLIDAPVSGSTPAGEAGTLTIITGGELALVEACLPIFGVMGSHVHHMGILGSGEAMKIVNNIMLHTNHLVILEALRLGRRFGLNEDETITVALQSTGRSWPLEYLDLMDEILEYHTLAGTDDVYKMFTKEQWNAVLEAHDLAVGLPFTSLACALSKEMCQERQAILREEDRLPARRNIAP